MSCADREVTAKEDISAIMEKCDAVSVAFAGEKVSRVRQIGGKWRKHL